MTAEKVIDVALPLSGTRYRGSVNASESKNAMPLRPASLVVAASDGPSE